MRPLFREVRLDLLVYDFVLLEFVINFLVNVSLLHLLTLLRARFVVRDRYVAQLERLRIPVLGFIDRLWVLRYRSDDLETKLKIGD